MLIFSKFAGGPISGPAIRLMNCLAFAACLGTWASLRADSCTTPVALEAKAHTNPSAEVDAEIGAWFEQQGQSACAIQSYRAALKADPRSERALDGLARSLIAAGDSATAIELLQAGPRDERLTLDLASAYEKAGAPEKASDILVRALRANPDSAPMTSAEVVLLANNGHPEDAYRLAERFAQLHPHDMDAQKLHLRVLVATNQATAATLARKLLALAPRDGELLYLNGVVEQKAGEFFEARGHLEQAIAVHPNFAEPRYSLGLVLARLQDPAGAKKQLEKAIELGATEPEARLELSKALRALGETQPADEQLKLYQQAMKASADREMAANLSAQAAQALSGSEPMKAVTLYREAVEAAPQDASLEYQLALALDGTGDTAGERVALEQAVNINPNLALAQHQLGYLLFRSGQYDVAEEHYRQAVRADPGFTQAWISLAATLATKSKFLEAKEAVAHALRLEPHNAEALEMQKQLATTQAIH